MRSAFRSRSTSNLTAPAALLWQGRYTPSPCLAVYVNTPTCAVAFVARWCVTGDPPGFYDLREQEPAQRVPTPFHKTPSFR